MPNPKSFDKLHEAFVADGVTDMTLEEMRSIVGAKGKKGVENRRELYEIARDGGYFKGSYEDFAKAYVRPVTPQKKEQMKNKARENSPVPRQPKPTATPQGQKSKPIQQPTPNKPDSVAQQYMPTYPDPTATTGQSKVRPQQGTGVLKRDSQIMADPTLSAEDKVALINDNRRRRGQSERNFNDYQEAAYDAGVKPRVNPVANFTDKVMAQHEAYNTAAHPTDVDSEGNPVDYVYDAVNKTPYMLEQDRIKEIADEINYYNTKQDQGGGGTTRIEDAINDAQARFLGNIEKRGSLANAIANVNDPMTSSYLENMELERTAGIDAVSKAAYEAFPDEIKRKYGEDVVRDAIYQVTLSTMKEKNRPKNFGQYLAWQLTNNVPGIISKAIIRHNSGSSIPLSDIAEMANAEYAQQFENEGFKGTVKSAVGGALPMVADPTMLIPFGGPAAKVVTTGLGKLAAKQAIGRGLEAGAVKLASKAAANKLINRGLTGAASTAVQMAAYEEAVGLANMANGSGQNFWNVTGEALESGAKMAPIGFIAPAARVLRGRVATSIADKGLSGGAQWAANTGAKLGISTAAFMTEAGVFAAPDIIGLAVNGTYTNEQARDIAIHSIATLAAFKASGMFNPLHIEQTKAMVKSMVSGTMGTELALDRHDSEALERLGYPKIQGDNILSLFVPLGERPEAKEGGGYFSMYSQIVLDERVPWSTRAKLIYVATGMLPETGVRPNSVRKTTDENGRIVVTTLQGNNPISQRFFDKKHSASADSYLRKVSHDVERMNFEGTKQDIISENTGGMGRSRLLNDALAKKPSERTPAEMSLIDAYEASVNDANEIIEMAKDIAMQGNGVDPEKALKKSRWERNDAERQSVERYYRYLNRYLDELRRYNYEPIAREMAQRSADDVVEERSNKDGKVYCCQLRDEGNTWYTVVDFDGTIERGEAGMDVQPGTNGDKMMVRNMATGETKMVTIGELSQISLDVRDEMHAMLEDNMLANYLNTFVANSRRASMYGKQPQNAEVGERLTLAADGVDPTTGLRPEYDVIDKDGNSGTYIVEDAQGNRKLINGHDILQKITDTEQQIPTQIAPQVPPTGPQTPPPAAPAQEPPVQPQGEAPAMPEQGEVFKLKVGDEFKDAEVIGKDDTGIIVRYEQNGTFRTEHLAPDELAPRMAPSRPVVPNINPKDMTNEAIARELQILEDYDRHPATTDFNADLASRRDALRAELERRQNTYNGKPIIQRIPVSATSRAGHNATGEYIVYDDGDGYTKIAHEGTSITQRVVSLDMLESPLDDIIGPEADWATKENYDEAVKDIKEGIRIEGIVIRPDSTISISARSKTGETYYIEGKAAREIAEKFFPEIADRLAKQGEGGAENGIPEDENGNKLFHKAEPKAVEDYFKNEKGYDDRFIAAIADKRIAEAQKDLADAGAKREKAYADVDEQAMDEAIAAERDAQERLDWWNKFKEGYGKEEQPASAGERPHIGSASIDDVNYGPSAKNMKGTLKAVQNGDEVTFEIDGKRQQITIKDSDWVLSDEVIEDTEGGRYDRTIGLSEGRLEELQDLGIDKSTPFHAKRLFKGRDGKWYAEGFFNTEVGPVDDIVELSPNFDINEALRETKERRAQKYAEKQGRGGGQPPVQESDIPQGTPRNTNIPPAPIPGKVPDAITPEEKAAQAAANAKRYNDAEKLDGYRVQITLPNGEKVTARYKVVPHDVVVPSHDPFNGYRSTPGYAEDAEGRNVNDRDYSDPNYQFENEKKAQNYDGRAITEPPVVNTGENYGGSVLGGNDRTMAGQLAATRGTDVAYLDALDYNIEQYGISRRALREFMERNPHARLVLEVEGEMPMTTESMAKFNQSGMKSSGTAQSTNKVRRLLTDKEIRDLAGIIGTSTDKTFGDLSRSPSVAAGILRVLKEAGIILENEQAEFLRANGSLSRKGEALLQEIVRASILDERGIKALETASDDYNLTDIEQRIDQITPSLIRNAALGEMSLRNEISRAIEHIRQTYEGWANGKKRGLKGSKKDALVAAANATGGSIEFDTKTEEEIASEQTSRILSLVFGTFSKEDAIKFFNEYERMAKTAQRSQEGFGGLFGETIGRVDILKELAKKYGLKVKEDNGPEQGQGQPGETETPGGNGGGNQGNGRPSGTSGTGGEGGTGTGRGTGEGRPAEGEGPVTPPSEPQGGGEPPKGEGEPPKPEEPGKPAGEPAGGPTASEPHQLTVDEINGLNLSQSTKENAIDYVNGDRGPRARIAYQVALKEWERVNGKSGEGKPETPPTTPEDNGPQEPPKGGGGTTGRGGGKPSTPKGGGKPAEPKPAEPKPESEGPKDSGDDIDLGGLDELGGFEGLFAKRKPNESRRPSREGEIVNEARYIPEEATEEQNRAVEKVIDVLAGIGKQLLEKKGMRTQSELVDFMRQNKQIRDALDRIGFDEEDKSNLYNDMWGQRVSTPWEGERSRMRLSEYADELSKTDKPKQDDKPKQIVSPVAPTVKNVVYKPNSKGKTNESIIPASMAQAVKTALGKINGGDTDGFVMDKVGFKDKDELYEALNAEQIDGVALAISAIERGEGLILGDMTGIGKGRQLAAVIRYARKEGIRPVFVTEKPGLFKDMMRDLLDVGADTPNKPFRPLILASEGNGTVTLADGSKVYAADAKTIEKLLSGDLDKLAKGYDALFVTYANLNSVLPEAFVADQNAAVKEKTHNEKTETREPSELTRKKLNLVAKWARGSIVVMDEAHNAAGVDSTQAIQWREIIDTTSGVNAKGVVMASATYAKTPKNYVLYALRTPIKEAHLSNNELLMTFARGGVPLQEWLASQLTGESYIRRERDMTGVNFDYRICVDGYDAEHPEKSTPEALEKVKAIRKSNDQAAKIANIMLALDNKASEAFKKLKEVLSPGKGKKGGAISVLVQQADGTYKEEMVDARMYPEALKMSNSTFASKIAMINAQLFMAEKAESAADAAIKAIKNGELPMIVFENTFDSLMDDLPVDEKGVLESVDYAQAFVRYLEQLGNFTIKLPKKNANGAQEVLKCRIDLSGDPDFALAKRMIETEGVGLHVSPVDRIRERLEEAGYKVGELSGRKNSIQKLADGKYHRVKRKTEDPDKVTDDYNTGKIDVLLINASGSTGRSMHEKGTWSEDGKEKIPGTTQSGEKMLMRPRHQIYVQNFNNETTMVQAMGRIDRTGQVEHGRYTFLMTPVPAETNILMRAQRKREQLKANTTAQQDRNSFDAVNASDFINKYGDEVVAEYLENNPKIANALQIPLKVVRDGTGRATSGLAKKATANAYTLTCDQQQEFYDDVQAAYDEYVKVLKENGDYDLETQIVDLQAETIADHMFVRGSHESDSMFSQDTNIARCRVKVQRKPMKVEEIEQHIAEVTGAEDKYEYEEKFQEKFDKHFADMEAEVIKEFEAKEQNVDNDGKKNDKLGKIRAFKAEAQRLVKDFPLDLLMPFYADTSEVNDAQGRITTESMPHAIVYDVKLGRTLGSSTIVFAVNDGRQKVSVRMNDDATFRYLRRLQIMPAEKFDRSEWNKSQGDAYEDAFIITGNLIGAYHSPIASRGRMIRYTDSEGNLHTGILMPRNFKTKDVTVEKPISEFYNQFKQFARYRNSRKDELPVFAGGQLEVENTKYTNEFCFSAKGELAKRIDKDPELEIYRTGKTVSRYRVFEHHDNTIQKVLGILAGRYGVSASVPIDPAHFMTREERDAEAESRMFRVEENIEETQPSAYSPYSGMPYVVHVPKERRKNVDATSDWLDKTIEQMNNNGLYGRYEGRRTNENGKRVYSEFYFQNKAMAEEFVKMVNNEPARPLAIDEKVEAKEPNWEEVDRLQHTYRLARPYEQLTGDDIAKTFGFRGVDTRSTNAEGVRDFYNAFMTMAMILNIDPKSISLGGNMDVNMLNSDAADRVIGKNAVAAFMKRGKANSYTGATQKGMIFREGGSKFPIAHEWLHAIDNYFGAFGLKNEETGFYEQSRMASESADRNKPWTARPEMRAAWVDLLKTLISSGYYGRLENEHFFKGSNFTDSSIRPQYWGKRTEMLARAFEAYMRKKITDNEENLVIVGGERMRDMISDGSSNTSGEFDPTEKEQYYINNAFDRFFETIKEKRDPDTGRVIMYEQAKPGETKREATMRETRNLNRVLAKTGLANSVTIDSERDFAEGVFASTGRPMRTLDGIVYGYTDSEGNIHLNAKYLNFETPIHEYGHLWSAWAKKNHGDLWQRGIELAKESDAFKKLKEESKKKGSVYNGMTDDQLADEVLADAIGKKGQDMYNPKDWTRTARVRHWLTQLWHRIGEALGFRKRLPNMAVGDMSFDDIIRTAAGDILGGKRLKDTDPDDRGPKGRRFSAKGSVPTFYSNAARAVENVKQNKATAEQWKAMLTNAGGIKAGEDKWMGLSEWLDEHKGQTLTKEEVAQFVADNGIQMKEVDYAEYKDTKRLADARFEPYVYEFDALLDQAKDDNPSKSVYDLAEFVYEQMHRRYGNDFGDNVQLGIGRNNYPIIYLPTNEDGEYTAESMRYLGIDEDRLSKKDISATRLAYTTNGLENKREIAFVVPNVEPYQAKDSIHFGPENKGRQIMWVRFGETTDTDGNRVLVIDEVQSNRHQDAREVVGKDENDKPIRKGYKKPIPEDAPEVIAYNKANKEYKDYLNGLREKYGQNLAIAPLTKEEQHRKEELTKVGIKAAEELREFYESNGLDRFDKGIPDAPFEKNWQEVAMKRMLRLAAEEGFDKVAWTTGEQQAKRYDLSSQVSGIEVRRDLVDGLTGKPEYHKYGIWTYDNRGNVVLTASGEMKPERIVELFGKDLGNRILATEEGKKQTIMGEGLTIGGEGMKDFYDGMLPQFMNKYGKRWGMKVGEVELNTPGKEVMHSVDITPEMRESVITQGQPLFQQSRNEKIDYYPNGEVRRVRNFDEHGNLTRVMEYDENRRQIRHWEPRIGTDWKRDENGVARGRSNGVEIRPYNFRFQQVAEPVKQAISSADTSRNQTPAGMNLAPLQPGTTNFDLGGGRWEKATNELAERGITNVVFDPFNRDAEHNRRAFEIVKNGGFDTVTCNNVLNVIAEPEVRSNVILQAAKALKPGGIAYFTVHEGDGKGNSRVTRDGWQEFRKTATYVDEVKQHFGSVERKGKLIIAKDPITDGQADWFMDKEQKEHIRFQQAPANNPAGSQQGNNEQLHIAREYAQDRTRTTTKLYEEVVENSVSLRHVLEDIARKSGKPIADYENVYLAENQSHGMMTTELITFRDRRVNPLNDALRKLAKHYGGEPTKNYVWARHGIERSIYVCFRERAYELAEKEAEAAARARGEEVTDKDINDAYNAMLDELYNATSGYSRRAYLESLETECSNILSAHGDTKPFEVTDKAGLTALNDKRSLVDDKPIENAWEIVKEYENNAGTEGEADIEALFDRLNDISKSMLDYSRDKGMMDKDTVEKIRKMFRFYVPLQGFAEGTMAQDYFEYVDSNPMRAGRAVPNTPKMRGRTGESADPIATLVRNAEMTIAAARRNTVATHLYNLATSRDTDLFAPARAWEAYDAAEDTWVPSTPDFTGCETTKDMMDAIRLHDEQMRQQRELGLAREARRGFSNRLITAQGAPKGLKMSMRQRHEHAVPVRINGKENVIYVLSDPRIAQIVNGTDKGSVDKNNAPFFYQANKLKRIQSGLMTSYNIAFWFANGARDIQNAFLRQAIMNGGGAAARTAVQGVKGDPLGIIPWEAMKLYNKAVKGTLDESKKHERYFKEFFEHGGITGYAFADQVEKIQSRVKKLLEHPKTNPRRLMFAVGELMEKAGGAFEIAPRFATYVASRDGGKSVMQSVADAKEATVNFDRRGARRSWVMRAAAAFYAFLNPGIQGMQNRLHQVRTHPGKTSVLHAIDFAMGYLWKGIAVACLAAMGRKDDEYDTQLTEYDRRNNICFPVGDDDWVKIPINMEDRVIWGLGDAVRNGMDFFPGNRYIGGEGKDEYDDNEDWMKYAGIVSAWFPIDVGSENNFIPTSLQPIYDVYINKKDFRGNSVDWRNDYNSQLPEYQRSNPYVTGDTWMKASKWWSEVNGGDEVTRAQNRALHGWDEINPQHMQYMFQSYLGGLGTTVGQLMSLVETIGKTDDDVKWNSFKFPIANRFWKGNLNEYTATKDVRNKARIWTNWANEISRRDREYRKRGAGREGGDNTLSKEAMENYEENLKYLELAKEIEKLARKKSQAKTKATKEGRTLTDEENKEFDNAFWEQIPDFEQKYLDIDGKRKVPEWRKHYDDD